MVSWSELQLLQSPLGEKDFSGLKKQLCRNRIPAEVMPSSMEEVFPPATVAPFFT